MSHSNRYSKRNTPHLPRDFLAELERQDMMAGLDSMIYSEEVRKIRICMTDMNSGVPLSHGTVAPWKPAHDKRAAGSLLHRAAQSGDHLLVHEMIRLGAAIDGLDSAGRTPLSNAINTYLLTHSCRSPSTSPAFLSRMRHIAITLIEQHADVNVSEEGHTYLHKACTIKDWELISLLLRHGAKAFPDPIEGANVGAPVTFLPKRDHLRFRRLVWSFRNRPRPLRMCPCWSRKPLKECHGSKEGPLVYPKHFRCICGSGKAYRSCSCSGRRLDIVESWDKNTGKIQAASIKDGPYEPALLENLANKDDVRGMMEVVQEMNVLLDINRPLAVVDSKWEDGLQKVRNFADQLVNKGYVDPAYAYALRQVNFSPRPQARSMNKRQSKMMQEIWNKAVDDYIDLGHDRRARIEIERSAKIGLSNGALYRLCEGEDCGKMEGKDIKTLRVCSKCKMAVYCSSRCQASHWPVHKSDCGTSSQYEQALPSQTHMFLQMRPLMTRKLADFLEGREGSSKHTQWVIDALRSSKPLSPQMKACADQTRDYLQLCWKQQCNRI